MKPKFKNLMNRKYFFDYFDPNGSYTGTAIGYDDESYYEPDQDADDL